MNDKKRVTFRHLEKGQEISGVVSGNKCHSFRGYVHDINAAFVTVAMWEPDGILERYNAEDMFIIELTDEEMRVKYNDAAGKIVKAVQNKLLHDQIGYHEMYNAWLSYDPWEMAHECTEKKLTVLGICSDIMPKTAMFSGEILDVGVCVEDEDGDRFWCHFRSKDIEIMIRRYERYQQWLGKHDSDDIELELYNVKYELEDENDGEA